MKSTRISFKCYLLLLVLLVACTMLVLLVGKYHANPWMRTLYPSPTHAQTFDIDPPRQVFNIIGRAMPTTYRSGSFIVYECSRQGQCGGWSDRLSGILTTFVIALITNKRFLINHNMPCSLEDYFEPNQLDWRYNSSILSGRTSVFHEFQNRNSDTIRNYFSGKHDLKGFFSHQVTFLQINWDFTNEFRRRPNISREVPWIVNLQYADIYKELFNYLFLPSTFLSRKLAAQNRTRVKTACAHIRVGSNPLMPADSFRDRQPLAVLWNFMDKVDKSLYDIFIAADNDAVKTLAKKRYPGNYIDTVGRITHIDNNHTNVDAREGFLKQLLDFYTLVNCDILIVANSGFSVTAAYLRNRDSGLYCFKENNIVPCTRYTIHDSFPGPILAPTY